jgi:hypothetical protein
MASLHWHMVGRTILVQRLEECATPVDVVETHGTLLEYRRGKSHLGTMRPMPLTYQNKLVY